MLSISIVHLCLKNEACFSLAFYFPYCVFFECNMGDNANFSYAGSAPYLRSVNFILHCVGILENSTFLLDFLLETLLAIKEQRTLSISSIPLIAVQCYIMLNLVVISSQVMIICGDRYLFNDPDFLHQLFQQTVTFASNLVAFSCVTLKHLSMKNLTTKSCIQYSNEKLYGHDVELQLPVTLVILNTFICLQVF